MASLLRKLFGRKPFQASVHPQTRKREFGQMDRSSGDASFTTKAALYVGSAYACLWLCTLTRMFEVENAKRWSLNPFRGFGELAFHSTRGQYGIAPPGKDDLYSKPMVLRRKSTMLKEEK